jgi:selenocysteine lyase/cysteine desulfurase
MTGDLLAAAQTESPRAATVAAFAELERGVQAALQTYSNVHRGSGHKSQVTSALFEQARRIILEYLGLPEGEHTVIFCTPLAARFLRKRLEPRSYRTVSSEQTGLPLGIRALAVAKGALPSGPALQSGGGTVKLVSPNSVIWADPPDRFEAGTPGIINAIALAKALRIMQTCGRNAFQPPDLVTRTAGQILLEDELTGLSGSELLQRLRHDVVGRRLLVPTDCGLQGYTNLDNAVSTPAFSVVWNAVRQIWRQPARVRTELIERVREIVGDFLGAPPAEYVVLFVGNTTEAINLVARIFGRADPTRRPVVLTSLLEHHSNELPWRAVPGARVLRLPVDDGGFVSLNRLEELLIEYNTRRAHGN